jgi:hypothetical protein
MRVKILVGAAFVLSALIASGYYFAPELRPFFPTRRGTDNIEQDHHTPRTPEEKEADARKKLPFESLTARLPNGKPITPTKALSPESEKRWATFDDQMASAQDSRAALLKALHEKTRKFFVESPGAGPFRGIPFPDENILLTDWHGDIKQPGEPADFPLSPGEALRRLEPVKEFYSSHENGLQLFLSPRNFGFIKDRDQVAGFKPHGFRTNWFNDFVHESKPWRINHVQLVGVLSHDLPVVYLTDGLPSMEQVRQGKTRTLDFFEEAALPALRDGEDLYIVNKDDTIRMLGAIRATKTCQKCHDADIGDLLGAFSYTLRPAPKADKGDR